MSNKQGSSSTKSNIAYNMAYQLLLMILPFITAPYVSRIIGSDGIGEYTYTYSIANYFVLFTIMGLANYGNRSIARVRDNQSLLNDTFSSIYAMQVLFFAGAFCIYFIGINIFHNNHYTLFLVQGIFVLSALFDVSWFFYGIEKFKMMVRRNGLIKVGSTIAIFILVKDSKDVWLYALILAIGYLGSNLYLWLELRKYVHFQMPQAKAVVKHIKPNLILFIPVIAISLYRVMDKIMIGAFCTMSDTGFYENAERLVNLPLTLVTSVGTVMLPKMSNLYARGDEKESFSLIRNSMQLIVMLSIALAFGIASISERFVPMYYGNDFAECITIVVELTPVVLFGSIANVIRTQYLIPKGKDKIYMFSVVMGAIINLIINALLIPQYASHGAVVGTLFAEFSVMAIQCISVRKDLPLIVYVKDTWYFFLSGAIMYFIVKLLEQRLSIGAFSIVIEIGVGALVYAIVSIILIYLFERERFLYYKKMLIGRK